MSQIYLDANATTPIDPRVREVFFAAVDRYPANPVATHHAGSVARAALEEARERLVSLTGVGGAKLIFTSGGTEANNLALWSHLAPHLKSGGNIVYSAIEHPCVQRMLEWMSVHFGFELRRIAPEPSGIVSASRLTAATDEHTRLVTLMSANNETGALQPIEEVAAFCQQRCLPFHSDTTQSWGREQVLPRLAGLSSFVMCAHKCLGPKGIGALVAAPGVDLYPLLQGGGQEFGLRSGTHNLPAILGMVPAMEYAVKERTSADLSRQSAMRDELWEGLRAAYPEAVRNTPPAGQALANTLSVAFPGIDAAMLLIALDQRGVTVSTGSACASGAAKPSAVLSAMGCPEAVLAGTLRLSMLPGFSAGELARVLAAFQAVLPALAPV